MPAILSDQSSCGESTYRSDVQDVVRSGLNAGKLRSLVGKAVPCEQCGRNVDQRRNVARRFRSLELCPIGRQNALFIESYLPYRTTQNSQG
jgi:hypothetical protein